MKSFRIIGYLSLFIFTTTQTAFVWANDIIGELPVIGKPVPNGTSFQPAATDVARDIQWLDNMLLIFVIATSVFIVGLLLVVAIRYNRRANPEPATFCL
jgi:cytochrome c oxidase subunit 2